MASIHHYTDGRPKSWTVHYRDPDGVQHSKGFRLEREAKAYRAEVEGQLNRGTYADPRRGQVTLAEFATGYLDGLTVDALTREHIEMVWGKHIIPGLGSVRLSALRPSRVQSWVAGLTRSGLGASYVGWILKSLRLGLSAAVLDRVIAENPCTGVRLPSAPKSRVVPWDLATAAAVRSALPGYLQATVDVGLGLGMRQGEVFGLAVEDIDWLRRVVHVRRQIRIVGGQLVYSLPKGYKTRDIPLPESVSLRLADHIQVCGTSLVELPWTAPGGKPESHELIFTAPQGGALNRNDFNKAWIRARDAAGVPRGRQNGFHVLRHTFASALLAGGVDIRALSEFLGHSKPSITLDTYSHLMPSAPDRMRQAVDAALVTGKFPPQAAVAGHRRSGGTVP